ncbi:MAG: tetratricopeptide repeat protein [Sandaracinus sp.]|nr:tetratricopeptide repeat protein [Sandaracinus sp.]
MTRSFLVAFALLLFGCPPTLSRPRSPEHLNALAEGERHARHGRHDEAIAAFAHAAETADRRVDRDEARYRQSRALVDAGRYDEAVALLDEIAAVRPPSRRTGRALYDAALLRFERLDAIPQALEGFERVVREHPDEGLGGRALHHWLGWMREHRGVEAVLATIAQLDAVLSESTLGDDLLWRRHELQLAEDRRTEAVATLELLIERHPYPQGERWDDAILLLATMDLEDGRPEAAVARLEAMLERAETTTLMGSYTLPAFPEARLRIARIHRDAGDHAAARRSYEALVDDFPDSTLRDDALYELASMQLDDGDQDGCDTLQRVLEITDVGRSARAARERLERDCAR